MFILVPIGHEKTEVRRFPIVSLIILALNVVVFLFTFVPEGSSVARDINYRFTRVFEYLGEHPYLSLTEEFMQVVFSGTERTEFERDLDLLQRNQPGKPSPERRSEEQERLDGFCSDALASFTSSFAHRLGYIPARPGALTLLTSMFVHAGWLHLIFNMLFFYLSGPFIEDVYGRPLFVAFYLTSGAAATLMHAAKFPDSTLPLVGASGAIAGLMGAFLIRFFATKIRFFYIIFVLYLFFFLRFAGIWRRLSGTFWAPAYIMLPLWLVHQVVSAQILGESAAVAFWAHIGGFLFGAFVALAIKLGRIEERFITTAIDASLTVARPPGLAEGIEAREEGNYQSARRHLERALRAAPSDPDVHLEMYRVTEALGDREVAVRHAARHINLELRAGRAESALATFTETSNQYPGLRWPAPSLLALGRATERSHDNRRALEILEELATSQPHHPATAKAMSTVAAIHERNGEYPDAVSALRRALEVPGLDSDFAQHLESRMREIALANSLEVPSVPHVVKRGVPPPVSPLLGPSRQRR